MIRAALVAALLVLALPAGASAQGIGLARFGPGAQTVSSTLLQVLVSGELVVEWESDPATCAEAGRCGLEGVMSWRPGGRGLLVLGTSRSGGRVERTGFVVLGGEVFDDGPKGVRASVRRATRAGSQLCADASGEVPVLDLEEEGSLMTLGLAAPAESRWFETRCAGPLAADVAAALPALRVSYPELARGRATLRLWGEGTFGGHGLRGRVRSTLALRVGRPQHLANGDDAGRRARRLRVMTTAYRVTEVRGEASAEFAGAPDSAACRPLDTCGLSGSLRVVPALRSGEATLTALARPSRGRRALRASLGLVPGGRQPRVQVFGIGLWQGAGRLETSVGRPGETPCSDAAEVPGAVIELRVVGSRVKAAVAPQGPRSRCAGPLGSVVPTLHGELPLRAFGRRGTELHMTGTGPLSDDGWTGTSRGDVTVVLQRTAVRETVLRVPG